MNKSKPAVVFLDEIPKGTKENCTALEYWANKFNYPIYPTNQGYNVAIIGDVPGSFGPNKRVNVMFLNDGYVDQCIIGNVRKGELKSIYELNKYGGYMGCKKGTYPSYIYDRWNNMLRRVNTDAKYYSDVTVSEEWLNFSNFAEWFLYNMSLINKEVTYEIDKDLYAKLYNLPRVYGPVQCRLIPFEINKILANGNSKTNYYNGVFKNHNKYSAHLTAKELTGKNDIYLGNYDTPEEARAVYLDAKRKYIIDRINYYKSINALTLDSEQLLFEYINKCMI